MTAVEMAGGTMGMKKNVGGHNVNVWLHEEERVLIQGVYLCRSKEKQLFLLSKKPGESDKSKTVDE